MSQIDPDTQPRRSAELIGELFDTMVTPLAQARRADGAPPYFPLGPDIGEKTYYTPARLRVMRQADYELPGGNAAGLLEALAASWTEQGEAGLVALIPRLREIASALARERAESDGNVDVLCYTLF